MILETMLMALHMEMTEADKKHYAPVSSDTHLFRPLGYKSPDTELRYRLLGTKVVGDNVLDDTWAYMSRSNSWDVVTVIKEGVSFAGSVVKEITNRKVVMENGDVYEQRAVEFLGDAKGRSGRNNRRSTRGSTGSEREAHEGGQSERGVDGSAETSVRNDTRTISPAQRERWRERARQFESASPEDRLRMIEQFRSMRRGRNR